MRVNSFEIYDPKDPDNRAAQAYRWLFFEAFRQRQELRVILEALRDHVLPIYQRVNGELSRGAPNAQTRAERRILAFWPQLELNEEAQTPPGVMEAMKALYLWAEKYDLRPYRWALSIAWRAVVLWDCSPLTLGDLCLWPPTVQIDAAGTKSGSPARSLVLARWLPMLESWDEFEDSSSELFHAWLSKQKESSQEFLDQGFAALPDKDYLEHLTYLGLYHCLRLSPQDITKLPDLSRDKTVVSKHIKSAAELIGVFVRGPGRPRKRRNGF